MPPSVPFVAAAVLALAVSCAAQESGGLSGRVVDASGATVPEALVSVHLRSSGAVWTETTRADGAFSLPRLLRGLYVVTVSKDGFAPAEQQVEVPATTLRIELTPATVAQSLHVIASEILPAEEHWKRLPGSADRIDEATLTQSRVFTIDEALRKAPGVFARGEEGLGLRPNIGVRGLNPTRSSKVLLLEDGIPLSYAPYGDNASYYHPPVERFQTIEVIKGAGQVLYGPSTVGGVINYVTPPAPDTTHGELVAIGGSRDYLNGRARLGTRLGATGLLLDYMRKQGDGARENTHFGLHDANVKLLRTLSGQQSLAIKASFYDEDSQNTYSGLRLNEFAVNPRANPFSNDELDFNRYGLSASHTYAPNNRAVLTTTLYGSHFARDWWRQSSNSAQRPNRASDPACGGMQNLYTTCGIEGRLREYYTWGLEPRMRIANEWFGLRNEMDIGVRAHYEVQQRRQENAPLPDARTGLVVEDNDRRNQAYSGFMQHRFAVGDLTISPGLRLEHVRYRRTNRLLHVRGGTTITQWIPGLGLSYSPSAAFTLFAGAHRGFAPPRTEDIINNTTGGSIDLDPELSWNYEIGVRSRAARALTFEVAAFRMDFSNQIIPASIAGGIGATLTNAGSTRHQGLESSLRADWRSVAGSRHSLWLRNAYTWVAAAGFRGARFSSIPGFSSVSISGNRLPYAPEHLLTSSVGYVHASGFNALVEGVYSGREFTDDLNTVNVTPDGQRGIIPPSVIWNATVNYPIEAARTTLFVTTKNALDRLYVVDRTRGILPNMPRLIQAGLRFGF